MPESNRVQVSPDLAIPTRELHFKATRSGGPGGQHVNTSSTRVELTWDVSGSPSLDDPTRSHLMRRLAHRLDARGTLRLVAQEERSQLRNRELVVERFVEVVGQALVMPKRRKKTRPTHASQEKRLERKRRRSDLKRERRGEWE